jgi:redox-sensitive bicupin YhaK (pirin superfamily)
MMMMLTRRTLLATAPIALTAACHTTRKSASGRVITQVIEGEAPEDGAGVRLRKMLGGKALRMLDPFLMLDEFKSDDPRDYQAGFPSHPHRGFETVTLMIDGSVAHADSVGNKGEIHGGGVQWMTAGKGIVHSEMPKGAAGTRVNWGYQLWINLPAKLKMQQPRYQELAAHDFTTVDVDGAQARVLIGSLAAHKGPIDQVATQPLVVDARIPAGGRFRARIPVGHACFVQLVDGACSLGETVLTSRALGVTAMGGDELDVRTDGGARVFVFAAAPIGEPVARRGPFVMNTDAEIEQAFADYRSGRLTLP